MIGHQTESVNLAAEFNFPFLEVIKVIEVVFIAGENNLFVVAALNNMMGAVWKD